MGPPCPANCWMWDASRASVSCLHFEGLRKPLSGADNWVHMKELCAFVFAAVVGKRVHKVVNMDRIAIIEGEAAEAMEIS
jgi:hypothetical protein